MWVGSKVPEGYFLIISRISTIYYFAHFLIVMPLLGKFEKTLPVPNNIFVISQKK
jgi:ubiquinol-cytochrome c reductase cytochrome b subunit|tara:strand:- start:850 stop:1014 length:165 start_codon:yes stop_codon:yes gene_type:complete